MFRLGAKTVMNVENFPASDLMPQFLGVIAKSFASNKKSNLSVKEKILFLKSIAMTSFFVISLFLVTYVDNNFLLFFFLLNLKLSGIMCGKVRT